MAAVFVNINNQDLFKQIVAPSSIIYCEELEELLTEDNLAIYTGATIQLGEVNQYFLSFDDVIKFIHFGKGVGSITIDGLIFSGCTGDMKGIKTLFNSSYSGLRGETTNISINSVQFVATITSCSLTVLSEPDTMAQFSMSFSVVDHQL